MLPGSASTVALGSEADDHFVTMARATFLGPPADGWSA
jgi:hypothetical protein